MTGAAQSLLAEARAAARRAEADGTLPPVGFRARDHALRIATGPLGVTVTLDRPGCLPTAVTAATAVDAIDTLIAMERRA